MGDRDPLRYVDPSGTIPLAIALCAANPECVILAIYTCYAIIKVAEDTARIIYNNECDNACTTDGDPDNFPALGKPTQGDGFRPPKKSTGNTDKHGCVPNPNGPGKGWPDAEGDVWVPTGGKAAHGGEHWDVQSPGKRGARGSHRNVYPGGKVR